MIIIYRSCLGRLAALQQKLGQEEVKTEPVENENNDVIR